jgi:uncharacterized protein (TIGR03435 family)
MERIAETIGAYGALAGEAYKPVVDRTGLAGMYDFLMEYTPGKAICSAAPLGPIRTAQQPNFRERCFLRRCANNSG